MQHVPRHISKIYKDLTTKIRKSHYLLGELILHPECNLDDAKIRNQIKRQRKLSAEVAERRASIEKLICRRYGNGHELVKQQRALIKGEK